MENRISAYFASKWKSVLTFLEDPGEAAHKILAASAICLAVGVLAGEHLVRASDAATYKENFPEVTLILAALIMLQVMRKERKSLDSERLGISAIYKDRQDTEQLRTYHALTREFNKSLFLVGFTLKDTLTDDFRQCVAKKCHDRKHMHIRLLMLSPEFHRNVDPVLNPLAADENALFNDYQLSLTNIESLAKEIHKTNASLEVRFYREAPTLSLTIADDRKMRVEMAPHNVSDLDPFRPMMDLTSKGDLFKEFTERYDRLWDDPSTVIYFRVDHGQLYTVDEDIVTEITKDFKVHSVSLWTKEWAKTTKPKVIKPPAKAEPSESSSEMDGQKSDSQG